MCHAYLLVWPFPYFPQTGKGATFPYGRFRVGDGKETYCISKVNTAEMSKKRKKPLSDILDRWDDIEWDDIEWDKEDPLFNIKWDDIKWDKEIERIMEKWDKEIERIMEKWTW